MPFSIKQLVDSARSAKPLLSITTREEYLQKLHEITRRTQYIEPREYFALLNELSYDRVDEIFAYFRTAFQIRAITQDDTYLTAYRRKLSSVVNNEVLVSKYSGTYVYKEFGEKQAEHLLALHNDLSDNSIQPIENSRSIRGLMKYMLLHYIQDTAIESLGESISSEVYHNILCNYHYIPLPEINQSEFVYQAVIDPSILLPTTNPFCFKVNRVVNRITYKKTIEFTTYASINNQDFVAVLELSTDTPCAELMNSILEKGIDIKICKNSYMISNTLTGTAFFRFSEGTWFL